MREFPDVIDGDIIFNKRKNKEVEVKARTYAGIFLSDGVVLTCGDFPGCIKNYSIVKGYDAKFKRNDVVKHKVTGEIAVVYYCAKDTLILNNDERRSYIPDNYELLLRE